MGRGTPSEVRNGFRRSGKGWGTLGEIRVRSGAPCGGSGGVGEPR